MEQWMNIVMYAIIMSSIAFNTLWILSKIERLENKTDSWHSIVIDKKSGDVSIYIEGKNV